MDNKPALSLDYARKNGGRETTKLAASVRITILPPAFARPRLNDLLINVSSGGCHPEDFGTFCQRTRGECSQETSTDAQRLAVLRGPELQKSCCNGLAFRPVGRYPSQGFDLL